VSFRAPATATARCGGVFDVVGLDAFLHGLASLTSSPRSRPWRCVSARSGHVFSLLFQSNSLREIPARLRAAAWMAMAEDERASGVAMA
jgi:hypothetical protein